MTDESWDLEDRYTIGFTENQYHSSATASPTPAESVLGYTSPALDYAERSNKGVENRFVGQSNSLERQRCKSVHKIQFDILNLVFELTERRKSATPFFGRSFDIKRTDSRSSTSSCDSLKSSSSLPLIEVQQLPPLSKPSISLPSLTQDTFKYVHRPINKPMKEPALQEAMKTKKEGEHTAKKGHGNYIGKNKDLKKKPQVPRTGQTKTDNSSEAKIMKVVREVRNRYLEEQSRKLQEHPVTANLQTSASMQKEPKYKKWMDKTNSFLEKRREIEKKGPTMGVYRGRYHTPNFSGKKSNLKLSYCQSSYSERAEKDRIDKIRRRHVMQTKMGPLDFNILRRQLTTGRSSTVI